MSCLLHPLRRKSSETLIATAIDSRAQASDYGRNADISVVIVLDECISDFASFETGDVAVFRLATIRGLSREETTGSLFSAKTCRLNGT